MLCCIIFFQNKGAKRFCTPPTFCISFLWRWPRCRGQRSFHRSTVGSQCGSGPFGTTYQGLCTKWRAAAAEDGRISVTCFFFWGGVLTEGTKGATLRAIDYSSSVWTPFSTEPWLWEQKGTFLPKTNNQISRMKIPMVGGWSRWLEFPFVMVPFLSFEKNEPDGAQRTETVQRNIQWDFEGGTVVILYV